MLRYEKAPECLFENRSFYFRRKNSKQVDYRGPPRYHGHLPASPVAIRPWVESLNPRGTLYMETQRPVRRMLKGVKYDTHICTDKLSDTTNDKRANELVHYGDESLSVEFR